MLKKGSSKDAVIFAAESNHFIILFLTLFSLLFVFTAYFCSEEIYSALQRRFIVPRLEKKFGFRGKREKIKTGQGEYEIFSIETVEPGSLFAQAGFKPGDHPGFHGCPFFVIGKTNEAMFYSRLNSIRNGDFSVFEVTNIDDYRNFLKDQSIWYLPKREVVLTTGPAKCINLQ